MSRTIPRRIVVTFALLFFLPACRTPDGRSWFGGPHATFAPSDQTTRRSPDEPIDPPLAVPKQEPPRKHSGPVFPGGKPSGGKPSAADLTLSVTAPRQVQQGRPVLFTAVIRNDGAAAARDARIEVAFDDGLRFPGAAERSFDQQLGDLAPRKAHTISLALQGETPGTRCARFRLSLDGRETVWKSVCVQVVPKRYAVSVDVAPLRSVGSRTEFTVTLANVSDAELKDVAVSVAYDPKQLKPHGGSQGAKVENGRITWTVNRLRPGVGVHLQGDMDCLAISKQVCLTADVTARDAPADREIACWRVVEQRRPFDMRIADTRDLIRVGDATEVVVSVQNRGGKRATLPKLSVRIPPEFRVVSTSVWEQRQSLAGKAAVARGSVVFPAVGMVDADGVITYRIRVEALKPCRAAFTATLPLDAKTTLELSEPVTVLR